MQKSLDEARKQKFLDLKKWALTTIQSIHRNYGTQKVWPRGYPGPYIGYRNTPAAKRSTGESFSYRNFYAKVYNMAEGDTEKISFFFRYYLFFVDMGVGRGRKWRFEGEDAKWNKLYEEWKGQGDRQQRPFLTMEIRHQITRLSEMVQAYYHDIVQIDVVEALEGLTAVSL